MSSGWTKRRDSIKTRVGAIPRRVLVVEGEDDQKFFEHLLTQRAPGAWEQDWVVGPSEGKGRLFEILEQETDWFGIIDRDECREDEIAERQADFPGRLFVLPRYCMESYFLVPHELWGMLSAARRNHVQGGEPAFAAALGTGLQDWIRHGALWHAVNPLWSELMEKEFNDGLLSLEAARRPDPEIRETIVEWHEVLNPDTVMPRFTANLVAAQAAPPHEQLTRWIHGKHCFRSHVAPRIAALTGLHQAWVPNEEPSNEAIKILAGLQQGMPFPADLTPIWQAIGLP